MFESPPLASALPSPPDKSSGVNKKRKSKIPNPQVLPVKRFLSRPRVKSDGNQTRSRLLPSFGGCRRSSSRWAPGSAQHIPPRTSGKREDCSWTQLDAAPRGGIGWDDALCTPRYFSLCRGISLWMGDGPRCSHPHPRAVRPSVGSFGAPLPRGSGAPPKDAAAKPSGWGICQLPLDISQAPH